MPVVHRIAASVRRASHVNEEVPTDVVKRCDSPGMYLVPVGFDRGSGICTE